MEKLIQSHKLFSNQALCIAIGLVIRDKCAFGYCLFAKQRPWHFLYLKKYENKVIFLTPAVFNSIKNTESCGAGICWEVFQGIMEQYLRKTCFILGELGKIFPF